MKKKIVLITLLLFGMAFMGCIADNGIDCPEDYTGPLTTNEVKLQGEWVLSAIVADDEIDLTDDGEDNPTENVFAQYDACSKDITYTFASNRNYLFEQAQNATNCENGAIINGTWQYSGNILSLISQCSVSNFAIDFNDENTQFSLSNNFDVIDINGVTISTEITYTYSATSN